MSRQLKTDRRIRALGTKVLELSRSGGDPRRVIFTYGVFCNAWDRFTGEKDHLAQLHGEVWAAGDAAYDTLYHPSVLLVGYKKPEDAP